MILLFSFVGASAQQSKTNEDGYPTRGFQHNAGFSTLTGITTDTLVATTVGFSFSNLIRLNQYFSVGAGFGIDFYGLQFGPRVLTPFYAEGRYDVLGAKEFSPYCAIRAGYATAIQGSRSSNNISGGVMVDGAAGVRVYLRHNRALNFGIGYRMQNILEESSQIFGAAESIKTTSTFSRFQVRVGFQFN